MKCNIVNVKEKNSPEFSSLMADGYKLFFSLFVCVFST